MTDLRIRTALISVADKTGLVDQARRLCASGVRIFSTGGSAQVLEDAGIAVVRIESATGVPSMMGGRVKTLHPLVHAGVLMRRDNSGDLADAQRHGIEPFDLVYVNLYPFADRVRAGADPDTCIEHIDIGGPAMLRAAAKNARWVTVCSGSDQLERVLDVMQSGDGATTMELRGDLAAQVFAYTARYEAQIAAWYADRTEAELRLFLAGHESRSLRYGENPHQRAHLYVTGEADTGVAGGRLVQGKPLSYNNIADLDAAYALAGEFGGSGVAAVVVKHCTPCGVALADTAAEAVRRARQCDPVSAFGGVIAVDAVLDVDAAQAVVSEFTEAVVAPGADTDALSVLGGKSSMRVVLTRVSELSLSGIEVKSVIGGFLVQDRDTRRLKPEEIRVASRRGFTSCEMEDALFAWRVVKHVRSNAIVFVRDRAVIGIGGGQTSRVDAVRQAISRAGRSVRGGFVVASDAYFPFADGVVEAVGAGASAVIQPGGSIRDDQVIEAADAAGIAMGFTGIRHFRH